MLTGAGLGSEGPGRPAWQADGPGGAGRPAGLGRPLLEERGSAQSPPPTGTTSHPKTQHREGLPHTPVPANLGHRGPGGHSIQTGVPGWERGQETPLRAPSLLGGQAA